MRKVFADTWYWIAICRPGDQWSKAAEAARAGLGDAIMLVTTDDILAEFLAALCKGPVLREKAAQMVKAMLGNANVRVVPHSRKSFLDGLDRYADRKDKTYSLTDCISMNVMEAEAIQEVLTGDHGFEQEGFVVLIREP